MLKVEVIAQKMLSIHDKWCLDIYKKEDEKILVAILIGLQHMIKERERRSSVSASSSSSSSSSSAG